MKKLFLLSVMAVALLSTGCTENTRAKHFGGTMTIQLQPNYKLVNVTWKESELWYLVRPRRADEPRETSTFIEKSTWGVQEGRVIFVEN